jgi:hypothetical protein
MQRPDPKMIARQKQGSLALVPESDRELATKPLKHFGAEPFPKHRHETRFALIALRRANLCAQLLCVVKLAIYGPSNPSAGLACERLIGLEWRLRPHRHRNCRQINDRFLGPAMCLCGGHSLHDVARHWPAGS